MPIPQPESLDKSVDDAELGPPPTEISGAPTNESEADLVEHEPVAEVGELSFKEQIASATTVDELCKLLEQQPLIPGTQEQTSALVVATIRDAEDFLRVYHKEIAAGMIVGHGETGYDLLRRKITHITRGGDLGIRQKAADLLQAQLEGYQQEHQTEIGRQAIIEATTYEQLAQAIKGINIFPPEKLKEIFSDIHKIRAHFKERTTDPAFWENPETAKDEIAHELRMSGIPEAFGIAQRFRTFLFAQYKNERLQREEQRIVNEQPAPSLISKVGGWVRGLFKRK